jgi:DNA-3-methyladenine glycosylase II
MRRITCDDDIAEGIAGLAAADPRLAAILDEAGPIPLRLNPPGFASMASIVISQQVSIASARAIHGRLTALIEPLTPQAFLAAGEDTLKAAGLSRPKQRALTALSTAIVEDGLDLDHLCSLDAEEATASLTVVKGIGPWTAEIYLLFCAGHPDIMPAGDLALQASAAHILGLEGRPTARELARIAESWSPWRGVAARLLWAHYGRAKGRDVVPSASEISKSS